MKNMSPQDLADENNELIQKNDRLRAENDDLIKKCERQTQVAQMYKHLYEKSVADYEEQLDFYHKKHPNLHFEYELFLEEKNQHL